MVAETFDIDVNGGEVQHEKQIHHEKHLRKIVWNKYRRRSITWKNILM